MKLAKTNGQLEVADGHSNLVLSDMKVIARGMFEYSEMFNLENDKVISKLLDQPSAKVLDMPGSTSTFGFQLRRIAERYGSPLEVFSADIIYDLPAAELHGAAVTAAREALNPLLEKNTWEGHSWVATTIPFHTPADLLHYREVTYREWIKDFEKNRDFYITDSFPNVAGLQNFKFDLIVSGNCLFAYADKLFGNNPDEIYDFHEKSILNLSQRLAPQGELRMYPIGTASAPVYHRLSDIMNSLTRAGFECCVEQVSRPPNVQYWDKLLKIKNTQT